MIIFVYANISQFFAFYLFSDVINTKSGQDRMSVQFDHYLIIMIFGYLSYSSSQGRWVDQDLGCHGVIKNRAIFDPSHRQEQSKNGWETYHSTIPSTSVWLKIVNFSASPFEIGATAEGLVLAHGVDSGLGIITSKIYNP